MQAVLIPAQRPSRALLDLVRAIPRSTPILIVDDGSGPAFAPLFDTLAAIANVTVIPHATRLGLGAALKTGINHALCAVPGLEILVTARPDDRAEDVAQVLAAASKGRFAIGAKSSARQRPLAGGLLHLLTGIPRIETLTGPRAIPRWLLARLLSIGAQGPEFETEMLLAARDCRLAITRVPVDGGTAAVPSLHSLCVYRTLVLFSGCMLLAALLDNLVFWFLWHNFGIPGFALAMARAPAALLLYLLLGRWVFVAREPDRMILARSLFLAMLVTLADAYAIGRYRWSPFTAKLVCDAALFPAVFAVLHLCVFGERRDGFWRGCAAALLAGTLAVEIYGFTSFALLRRAMWFPDGPYPLLQFAGVYAAFATAMLILVPWLFVYLAAAALALCAAIVAGPLPVLAAALFALSAWALGSRLLGRGEPVLSTLLGVAIYIFLMPFVARLPVNYPLVYLVLLAIPIALQGRSLRRPPAIELGTWGERAAFAALALFVAVHCFAALKPEAGVDALSIHLAVPANIRAHHMLTFEPARFLWAVMPMGADFTYAVAYQLGGEFAARLVNFGALLAILALIYTLARRWTSPAIAWLLAALFASTPLVYLVSGSLYVENLLAALLLASLGALWRFGDTGAPRFLYASAALAGAALATKLGAFAMVVPGLAVAYYEVRRRAPSGGRAPMAAAALLAVTAAPPYAIAWTKTGNPVFPFLNDFFRSPLLPLRADIADVRYQQALSWATPFDLTFHSARYFEGQDGAFGFQYLWLIPLAVLAVLVVARRQAVGASIIAVACGLIVLASQPNLRYLYPALPLLSVPFAALVGARFLPRALPALAVSCLWLNACALPATGYYFTFYPPFTAVRREALIQRTAPIRKIYDWLNRTHPGAPVLLAQDSATAGLNARIYENHWHQFSTLDRLRSTRTTAEARRLLDGWGVGYVIWRLPYARSYPHPESLRGLIDHCVVAEYVTDEFYVGRLEPACDRPALPAITATTGRYNDFDPRILYRGEWFRDDRFPAAWASTITYTDDPGATATFAFAGDSLVWRFTRASNRGIAEVTIDGSPRGGFDLYSQDVQWQSTQAFENLGAGRHLLVIRVSGQKRLEADGAFVDIDSLEVKP
jgi:hypothetical protein